LFTWIEWLKDYVTALKPDLPKVEVPELEMVEEKPSYEMGPDGYAILEGCPTIYHSKEPLVERKSVFVAHCAKVTTLKQIKLVRKTLMSNKQVAKATHNIAAYRIVEANGVVRQDGDDDGETAAGARLLHLLQLADCQNVYVVVSRWYGGVELGPTRFKCINNCARQLLEEHGFLH
jgi:putative IMPACT (imprinted ancient) family translation regulator